MGRLREFWGEDAAAFKPERWLGDGDKKPRQTPFAWLAFLAGERSCIGQRFAMLEMKAVLATMLTRFELLELPGAPAPQPSLHVTLRPSPALRLRLRSRRQPA